ncbi:MAG: hypothetical protein IJ354_02795 [Clostridia bacterium]|nr:hypothetical protein [Clostridia bacterium]
MVEAYEQYQLPHEAERLRAEWMTPRQAADVWGVSVRTARRYFSQMYTWPIATINVRTDKVTVRRMLPAGTAAPDMPPAGNPNFCSSDYQKALAGKRWQGHMTKAQRDAIKAAANEEAIAEAVSALPPIGMPAAAEEWQPYPEQARAGWPTDAEGKPLPPQLVYPDLSVRKRMERKARRDPRVPWPRDEE